jgi:signal transduction histidine kinase
MAGENSRPVRLSSWPVILGLGAVTLLIAGMIGLDVLFSQRQAATTANIIENVQRSTLLLNDIRVTARRMAETSDAAEFGRWRATIADLATVFDPLATFTGEREEWTHLQGLLTELSAPRETHRETARPAIQISDEIDKSASALVSINTAEGNINLTSIRAAQRQALWSDIAVGAGVLIIVALISVWLLRVLARQRRLVDEHVHVLSERNSELEAFAARAAHDLRSPMNPIRGYADLILEAKELPDEVPAMAQRIRRAVDRMARVVDDMLALSTSGRPPKGESSPAVVAGHVVEDMGAELHDITVATAIAPGSVACADSVLGQILRNLIGNAIKFRSHARPLRIRIESKEVGDSVEIAVEDNGVGMEAESAKHAFEPFYRGHSDRELPGHGLGLAIVDRTVRALGGTCQLQSILDRGTRIVVRLPRA